MSTTWFATCLSVFIALTSMGAQGAVEQKKNSPLWLSGTPPTMELMKQFSRAHGGMVIRDEERNYSKMLWLRSGTHLKYADYLSNKTGRFYLIDQKLKSSQPSLSLVDPEHTAIKFEMPDEGFYNAYYLEQAVLDGVRYVNVAKREVLKHDCGLGHKFDVEQHRPQSAKQIPLEILRLRFDDETYHTRFNSGKNVLFKVLYNGKPLAGAAVIINTEEGWSRKSKSDSEGIVSFQVIQDRFQENEEKKEHKKGQAEGGQHGRTRHSEQFLVTVQHTEVIEGEYNSQPYQQTLYTSTFPGQFSASQSVYKSYAYGLIFGSAGFLFLGVCTYLYRRRRIKPFKEVSLDE